MAKFTKSRARKPLVEGEPMFVYSKSYDGTPNRVKVSLRMGETGRGDGIWLSYEMTDTELDALVKFRNDARERNL